MDLSFRFLTFVCSHPFRAKRDTNYSFESVSVILLLALGVVTALRKCGGTYDDFVASAGADSRASSLGTVSGVFSSFSLGSLTLSETGSGTYVVKRGGQICPE